MNSRSFKQLKLIPPILQAVEETGYAQPTAIQSAAIPHLLKGRDILATARTGSGKTAAFALPILQSLHQTDREEPSTYPRALVLVPTRELAMQVDKRFSQYGKFLSLSNVCIVGGVNQSSQVRELRGGVDIVTATPGRLIDLIGQNKLELSQLTQFVLDEADRLLDMGFLQELNRIIELLPPERQSFYCSATMTQAAAQLAKDLLKRPVRLNVAPASVTNQQIDQSVVWSQSNAKLTTLVEILASQSIGRGLVFVRTKHGVEALTRKLNELDVDAAAIHANKTQSVRTRTLERFREQAGMILIATDIAARGLDIDQVSHVINFDLPNEPETYVHRIGRTGRAGAEGVAISICTESDRAMLGEIETLIGQPLPTAIVAARNNRATKPKPKPKPKPTATAKMKTKTKAKQKTKSNRRR